MPTFKDLPPDARIRLNEYIVETEKTLRQLSTSVMYTEPAPTEEGNFTATLTCSTSGSYALHASNKTLAYTKIGDRVFVDGKLQIVSASSPVGQLLISLPLDPTWGAASLPHINILGHGGTIVNPVLDIGPDGGAIYSLSDSGALSAVTAADVDTAFNIHVHIWYKV